MRAIPVDTTRVRFIATGKHAARAVYAELSDGSRKRVPDSHDKDEQGRPMWVVDVMVDDPDAERAEIAAVKVASYEVPETRLGDEVRFLNLVAVPYVAQGTGRVALSFRADGIENTKPKAAAA
ncbi:hypothetical protein [Pseudonocardia broussonetiae]|uniref:Plasmid replication, integration and excision activator n=1 Tax=Pseudonocardia broussonetiae TaxID=2736640 RepID=A0A6M6JHM8_9PSEU|nr:hypothetical protein [Pseudonocardia broussonetiae]QJY46946.1 hypothetical protein HOP40_14900 [Pseudonocardia broussonetiae]